MNEELIRQCAEEACGPEWYGPKPNLMRGGGDRALRLYHARAVAPLVEAAMEARRIAMEQTVAARVPECGKFSDIAQDLDAALSAFGDAPAPEPPLAPEVRALVEAATKVCARWSFYDDTTLMADLRTALAPFQQGAALSALAETDGPFIEEAK